MRLVSLATQSKVQVSPLHAVAHLQMGYPLRGRVEHVPAGDATLVMLRDLGSSLTLSAESLSARTNLPDAKTHHFVQQGDLIFKTRGSPNTSVIIAGDLGSLRLIVTAPLLRIRIKNQQQLLPAYLNAYLASATAQAYISGIVEDTTLRMVSKADLASLPIPIPSLVQQQAFAELALLIERESFISRSIIERRRTLLSGLLANLTPNHHLSL